MRPIVDAPDQAMVTNLHQGVLHKILRGPNGYRALWRLLVFAAIFLALRYAAHFLFRYPLVLLEISPRVLSIFDGVGFLMAVAAALIMARLEKRPFAAYGLPVRGAFAPRFLEGIAWGLASQCATLGILCAAGTARISGADTRGAAAFYFALAWGGAFLLVGLAEEFQFRGYAQYTIATGIGFWPAAIVMSGSFWIAHMFNPDETWIGGLTTFLAAMAFCVSLRLTGNLWFAVGMHAGWDWTETYFFGVADSGFPASGHLLHTTLAGSKWMTGGIVGPEGSVVEILVTLLLIALIYLRFRRVAKPRAAENPLVAVNPVA